MSIPYRYVKGAVIGKDDTCALCSQRSVALVVEHCHTHGYTRGLACSKCNNRLSRIDAGAVKPTPQELFYLANCPECRRVESSDSPDARMLRVGAIALAISVELGLTPRQGAALALSLAHDGESERLLGDAPQSSTQVESRAPRTKTENIQAMKDKLAASPGISNTQLAQYMGVSDRTVRRYLTSLPQLAPIQHVNGHHALEAAP